MTVDAHYLIGGRYNGGGSGAPDQFDTSVSSPGLVPPNSREIIVTYAMCSQATSKRNFQFQYFISVVPSWVAAREGKTVLNHALCRLSFILYNFIK